MGGVGAGAWCGQGQRVGSIENVGKGRAQAGCGARAEWGWGRVWAGAGHGQGVGQGQGRCGCGLWAETGAMPCEAGAECGRGVDRAWAAEFQILRDCETTTLIVRLFCNHRKQGCQGCQGCQKCKKYESGFGIIWV